MISKACTNGKQWMHSSSSQVQKLSEFFSGNFKGSSKTHANFPELQGSSKKHKICKTKLRGSKNGLSESCTILVTSMQESPGHNKTTGVSRTHKNLVVTTEMCENASCFFVLFFSKSWSQSKILAAFKISAEYPQQFCTIPSKECFITITMATVCQKIVSLLYKENVKRFNATST